MFDLKTEDFFIFLRGNWFPRVANCRKRECLVRCHVMQTMTDAELLVAYSSRQDEGAFGELMRRHGTMAVSYTHLTLPTNREV